MFSAHFFSSALRLRPPTVSGGVRDPVVRCFSSSESGAGEEINLRTVRLGRGFTGLCDGPGVGLAEPGVFACDFSLDASLEVEARAADALLDDSVLDDDDDNDDACFVAFETGFNRLSCPSKSIGRRGSSGPGISPSMYNFLSSS